MSGLAKEGLTKIYRDFIKVCEQWPVDVSRTGRDFGEHMRNSYEPKFQDASFDHDRAKRTVDALMRISTNYYRKKYPRLRETSYTSQEEHVFKSALSNDGQSKVEPHQTWWERMFGLKKKQ